MVKATDVQHEVNRTTNRHIAKMLYSIHGETTPQVIKKVKEGVRALQGDLTTVLCKGLTTPYSEDGGNYNE